MNSRLPILTGAFPLNSTFVLRLMNLLEGSNNSPMARQMITDFLNSTRLSADDPTERDEVLHFFRFTIDYLQRLRLIDAAGKPMNLAAIGIRLVSLCFKV